MYSKSGRVSPSEAPKPAAMGRAFGGGRRRALGDVTNRAPTRGGGEKPASAAAESAAVSSFGAAASAAAPHADRAFALSDHGVVDIDAIDRDDPQQCAEYVKDIYKHYKEVEVEKHVSTDYMAHQTDINAKMRSILVDWLVEVHLKFKLMPETLYLTVNLIDRYLERKLVQRSKLQLVGVTCMLIAAKYEEIYAPEVRDFTYITDSAYSRKQILSMEASVLATLKFKLTVPTAYVFTRRFLKAAGLHDNRQALNLVHYLVERTLQEYDMLRFKPSEISAAATNIALRTLKHDPRAWSRDRTLEVYTGFTHDELIPAIRAIEKAVTSDSTLRGVKKKYSSSKFFEVAKMDIDML